jgi:hypothetical protein
MHIFRRVIESNELDRIGDILAGDVLLNSPIAFKPYRGRETVAKIINLVYDVLDDFAFHHEIGADGGAERALVFNARIGGLSLQGCDFVHTDHHGHIDELTVMMRPLQAVQSFEKQMRERFAAAMAAPPVDTRPAAASQRAAHERGDT